MRDVGRGMQIVGLIALPLAMLLELTGSLDRSFGVSQMVIMLVFGAGVFYAGRLIEGYSG